MSEHSHHPGPHSKAPYETSDASIPAIAKWGGILFAVIFVAMGLMWVLHIGLSRVPTTSRKATPMELERRLPPAPRLQVNQARDLEAVRAREALILNSYGWVQKESGTVRLPIERAMALVAERGLPQTPAKGATPARPRASQR